MDKELSPLDRHFDVSARGSTLRLEILGGLSTFLTMAYIIVVNPAILAVIGIPPGPSTVATILTAVFGCVLMGLFANLPIAVAPYMGENAFLAFGLITLTSAIGKITWQQCLGSVFVSGLVFLFITVLGVRSWLARAISPSMKYSFAVGIGLFLAFIGLYQTGIVTSMVTGMPRAEMPVSESGMLLPPSVPVKIGDLRQPRVLLAIGGFLLMAVLLARQIRGAILIGIVATALVGVACGVEKLQIPAYVLPFTGEYSLTPILGKLDIAGVLRWAFFPMLLTLFMMSFLDTLGTLVAVGAAGDMLDADGNLPRMERPMLVDALACCFGPLIGTSTSGAYIESAVGIREGARTGLAALVTAACFATSLFLLPLATPLQKLGFAYWPALIAVGMLMMQSISKIQFEDATEVIPAFTTIVMILFTFNIANGLTAGLLVYPIVKIASGRFRDVAPGAYVLALLCGLYYAFGILH